MGTPCDGFDGCFVAALLLAPAVLPALVHLLPNEDFIIVASRC